MLFNFKAIADEEVSDTLNITDAFTFEYIFSFKWNK